MRKFAIALIAACALGIGSAQAAPVKLTTAQMETITAGSHYRLTGSLTTYLLAWNQYLLLLGH